MERVVLEAYKAQLAVLGEKLRQTELSHSNDPLQECRKVQKIVTAKLSKLDRENLEFYEQYRAGELGKEEFLEKKTGLLSEKERLRGELTTLQDEEERLIMDSEANDKSEQALKQAVESMAHSDERLRTEMYDAVKRVIVYDNAEVEIEWKDTFALPDIENAGTMLTKST